MRIFLRLCTLCLCGPLAVGASAAESPAHAGSSPATAHKGLAVAGGPPGRDAHDLVGRSITRSATHDDTAKIGTPGGRDAVPGARRRHGPFAPPRAAAALVRHNGNRLQSPPSAYARARSAPNRRLGATAGPANGNLIARTTGFDRNPQGLRTAPAATSFARAAPSSKPDVARSPILGGPHAAGMGRLGGPALRRSANTGGIDGTQVRRKY